MKRSIQLLFTVLVISTVKGQSLTSDVNEISETLTAGDRLTLELVLSNNLENDTDVTVSLKGEQPVSFVKSDSSDWELAENQDHISEAVSVTRKNSRGIFNIVQESAYSQASPLDTEWAFGSTSEVVADDYSPWRESINEGPTDMIEQVMSLHLISEHLYYDVEWHEWTCCGNGGGFSYTRTPIVKWITVPKSFSINANGDTTIQVSLNADRKTGTLKDTLVISTNGESLIIPIELNVIDGAGVAASLSAIHFGDQFIGSSTTKTFKGSNLGNKDLLISELQISDPNFTISPEFTVLKPGEYELFELTFEPTSVSDYSGNITIISNDSTDQNLVIQLTGSGVEPPVIGLDTESITSNLLSGEAETQNFVISNSGNSNLYYSVDLLDKGGANNIANLITEDPNETIEYPQYPDISEVYSSLDTEELSLKMKTYDPINQEESWTINTIIVAIDADQDQSTGLDINADYNWSLGIDYLITFSGEGFTLEEWTDGFDFEEVAPVGLSISFDPGEIIFILPRSYFPTNFNFSIIIENGDVDQVPDEGHLTYELKPSWLSLSPEADTVGPGSQQTLEVDINGAGLIEGSYDADIIIENNDPVNPVKVIPVALNITGIPAYSGPETVDFGNSYAEVTDSLFMIIMNIGTADLSISEISSSNNNLSFSSNQIIVPPLGENGLWVYLNTSELGPFEASINLTSNDSENPSASIAVTSMITSPPVLSFPNDPIEITVNKGTISSHPVAIANTGGTDLTWEIIPNSSNSVDLNAENSSVYFDETSEISPEMITLSMWIYLEEDVNCDDQNNWRILFNKGVFTDTGFDVLIEDNNSLNWDVGTEEGFLRYGGEIIPVGEWVHCSFTYDGNRSRYFINGAEKIGETFGQGGGPILSNWYGIELSTSSSGCQDGSGYFPGKIAEVRIWDYPRTAEEIKKDMYRGLSGTEEGLVFYSNFNEGEGSSTYDLVNDSEGYLFGDAQWSEISPFWFSFDTLNGSIEADGSDAFEITVDASTLRFGVYELSVGLTSNDPLKLSHTIPFDVIVYRALGVDPTTYQSISYPNPFQDQITFECMLERPGHLKLTIFNLGGQQVFERSDEVFSAGPYYLNWDGRDSNGKLLKNGIYLSRMDWTTDNGTNTTSARIMIQR